MDDCFGQGGFDVRMEWGFSGAVQVGSCADYVVIVDVLSFTTPVSVALDRGVEVFPYPWDDPSAQEFANKHDAVLGVGRSVARDSGRQPLVSLSPASIRAAAGLQRIVLPSPNGSALATRLVGGGSIGWAPACAIAPRSPGG